MTISGRDHTVESLIALLDRAHENYDKIEGEDCIHRLFWAGRIRKIRQLIGFFSSAESQPHEQGAAVPDDYSPAIDDDGGSVRDPFLHATERRGVLSRRPAHA